MRSKIGMVLLLAGLGCGGRVACAQSNGTQRPGTTTQPTSRLPEIGPGADGNDPMAAQREAGRVRSAANDRMKRMQQDTTRLLELAQQLKDAMDKSNKFEMSLDVIRKAEEIEKLARDVRTRMKG